MLARYRWPLVAWWGVILGWAAPAAEPPVSIPNDSVVVLDCKVRQLLDTPLGRHRLVRALESPDSESFPFRAALQSLGISLVHDVHRVTVCLTALDTNDGWIRLEGRFSKSDVYQAASQMAGRQPETWRLLGDEKSWSMEIKLSPSIYLHLPDDNALVVTTNKALVRPGDRLGQPKPELRKLCEKIESPAVAWIVLLPEALIAVPARSDAFREALEQVTGAWGRLHVDTAVRLEVALLTNNSHVAKKLKDFLGEALRSGKLFAAPRAQELSHRATWLDVLGGIHVTEKDQQVRLVGEWSARQVDELIRRVSRSP